jgi:hypothetical protein
MCVKHLDNILENGSDIQTFNIGAKFTFIDVGTISNVLVMEIVGQMWGVGGIS